MAINNLPSPNPLHIGLLLKNYIDSNRIYKSPLARILNKQPGIILRYQKAASLKTNILFDLSHALHHNFFADIADTLPKEYTTDAVQNTTNTDRIAALEEEVKLLKAENATLLKAIQMK